MTGSSGGGDSAKYPARFAGCLPSRSSRWTSIPDFNSAFPGPAIVAGLSGLEFALLSCKGGSGAIGGRGGLNTEGLSWLDGCFCPGGKPSTNVFPLDAPGLGVRDFGTGDSSIYVAVSVAAISELALSSG